MRIVYTDKWEDEVIVIAGAQAGRQELDRLFDEGTHVHEIVEGDIDEVAGDAMRVIGTAALDKTIYEGYE